ncbi:MAG: hypothetical protein WB615_08040 [Candidatus Tumulicola sp.]
MMQPNASGPWWLQLIPVAVILAILAVRYVRPQRISVTRMWISPLILVVLTAWAIYGNEILNPSPAWEIAAAMFLGVVAGIPFGILRGLHTDVRPTERRNVMYLGSTWVTIVIFLAAFGLRAIVRIAMPHRGSLSSAIGDGLLGFAIAFIVASYIVIFKKYEAEVAGRLASEPAPPVA